MASDNIRVNCIAPGIIKTKFAEVTLDPVYLTPIGFITLGIFSKMLNLFSRQALTDNEDIAEKALENLPLGR